MFTRDLTTKNPAVKLIKPDIERDAPLSVRWLADPHGRETLRLMGVVDVYNTASDLESERARVRGFLEKEDQYNWAIELGGHIVGAIWLDREATEYIQAPTVSIMIGDPAARGKGVGRAALEAVVQWAFSDGEYTKVYSRYLIDNQASGALLERTGFRIDADTYTDEDGLTWQNVSLSLTL